MKFFVGMHIYPISSDQTHLKGNIFVVTARTDRNYWHVMV